MNSYLLVISLSLLCAGLFFTALRQRRQINALETKQHDLKLVEMRYHHSQASANFGVWEWQIQNDVMYLSDETFLIMGIQPDPATCRFEDFSKTVHHDDINIIYSAFNACIENGLELDIKFRVIWADASLHWLQFSGNRFLGNDQSSLLIGTVREITRSHYVEDVLLTLAESRSSEKNQIFQTIVSKLTETQGVSYALVGQLNDKEPGLVDTLAVWGNGKLLPNFSYYLVGTPCQDVTTYGYCMIPNRVQSQFPDDLLLVELGVQSYVGVPLRDSNQDVVGILALLDKHPMKHEQVLENLLNSLAVRASIELERSRATESLQIAALVYQYTQEAMLLMDQEQQILAVNPAFSEITGYSESEALTSSPKMLISSRNKPEFLDQMIQRVQETGRWKGEFYLLDKLGQELVLNMTITAILDDQKVWRFIVLFNDITEQKNNEALILQHRDHLQNEVARQTQALEMARNEAVKANQAKSEFLGNMSHELRTPMHGILSFAQFGLRNVAKGDLEKLGKYFDRINQSGERLLLLLNDLLDLTKLEAGKMEFHKEPSVMYNIVNNSISELEGCLLDKQLSIEWLEKGEKLRACLDRLRMSEVVTNLLSNAIKFSPEGGTIRISINKMTLHNHWVLKLSIQDEGEGVADDELEAVFDKFTQSAKSKTDMGQSGTGLGLAICKEIVRAHQGKIWVENVAGSGADFQLILPVKEMV